jgi:hypothetical protein
MSSESWRSEFQKIDRKKRLCHSPFFMLFVPFSPSIKLVRTQLLQTPMHLPRRPVEPFPVLAHGNRNTAFAPATNKQYRNHHRHNKKQR